MVIKRIGPVSCAKISGTLYAAIGLIFGAIFSMVALAGGMAANSSDGAGMGALLGVGAIIVLPVCYGLHRICRNADRRRAVQRARQHGGRHPDGRGMSHRPAVA